MTPKIADTGHSFKGAFLYYLNDKRADPSDPHPTTGNRVGWTETRNLATENPHVAWRVMRATASQADALKEAAGVRNTGRKATGGPVFSYSLSWEPDAAASLTREHMAAFADRSIKALRADHLQAVVICHTDTAHPHVHVVINRIDPATGKTHSFGQSKNRLSDLAAAYERERGKIVTPKRQQAAEARAEARKHPAPGDGPKASWAKRRRDEKAREQERQQQAIQPGQAAKAPRIVQERPAPAGRPETPAARLKRAHDAQKANHAAERGQLWADQQARRAAILEAAGREIKARAATAKGENRPLWADLYRQQKAERRRYDERERHIAGKVWNAIEAVTSRQIRGDGSDSGFLTMAFGYLASSEARRVAFEGRLKIDRDQLTAANAARLAADMGRIKEARDRQLAESRATFDRHKAEVTARQGREVADIRAQWRAIYAERERAAQNGRRDRQTVQLETKTARRETRAAWSNESTRRAEASTRYAEARAERAASPQERQVVKNDYDKARDPRPPAPPVPTRPEMLSRPAPAPSPAGDVPPAKRTPQPVPVIDKARAWAQAQPNQPAPAPPPVRKDWARSAAPPAPPTGRKDWTREGTPEPPASPRKDWGRSAAPAQPHATSRKDWAQAATPTRHTGAPVADRSDEQSHDAK